MPGTTLVNIVGSPGLGAPAEGLRVVHFEMLVKAAGIKAAGIKAAGIFAIGVWWLNASSPAAIAQLPEPPPSYAQIDAQRADASLHAVAFYNHKVGIAAGDHGTILRTDNAGLTWQQQIVPVACRLDDAQWLDSKQVLVVGGAYDRITGISRGVVLASRDGGLRWQRMNDKDLPRLRSLRRTDSGMLIASGDWSDASLTREFESRDGGRTWRGIDADRHPNSQSTSPSPPAPLPETSAEIQSAWMRATGRQTPIRDYQRVDSQHLWAVGDHGVIVQSDDGGHSWRDSRGGGRQAAILMIANASRSVGWSLLGKESLELRHRTSVLLLDHSSADSEAADAEHHQAAKRHSLALARQAAAILGAAGVDRVGTDEATFRLDIRRWLALHQPVAVILDTAIAPALRQEITAAAMAANVRRVTEYTLSSGHHTRSDSMLHRNAMLAHSGVLAGDLSDDASQLVAPMQRPVLVTTLQRRYDAAGGSRSGESVLSGIVVPPHLKRSLQSDPASRRQLQIAQARMSESKRIDELVNRSDTPHQFATNLKLLLDQTAGEDQFRLAWNLWRQSSHLPRTSATRLIANQEVTLKEIASRFEHLSAGKWAAMRIDEITHSLEWKRLRDALRHDRTASQPVVAASSQVVPVSPFQLTAGHESNQASEVMAAAWQSENATSRGTFGDVAQASATVPLLVADTTPTQSAAPSKPAAQVDLAWEFHPAVLFSRDAARRRSDHQTLQPANTNANLLRLTTSNAAHAWSHLAASRGPFVASVGRTEYPPRLDGLTNDACWSDVQPQYFAATSLRMAYDDQYIYLAIRCPASQLRPDAPLEESRHDSRRDQDLTAVDRVQLRLDTDADLATSMELEMTAGGRTRDSIDGQTAWQPTWYVATHRSPNHVDLELAIWRPDLADLPIVPGESWLVSVRLVAGGNETLGRPIADPSQWVRVVFR